MSLVYKALLPYPASPGEKGVPYGKIPSMGGFAGFICAARSCHQQGEMNSEQLKRRWVVAEHCGLQDFGIPLARPRESLLPPAMDKSSPILSYWAVPPAHGSIHSIPWAWLRVGEPRQSWVP